MQIRFTKGRSRDYLQISQADGLVQQTQFPHKGPFPHDAVHMLVEEAFKLSSGFWGRVAGGDQFDQIAELSRQGGHASAKRAQDPDPEIIELIQAERLVECFEAEIWAGYSDVTTFRATFEAACQQSRIPSIPLHQDQLDRVRERLKSALDTWERVEVGQHMMMYWSEESENELCCCRSNCGQV